MNNQIPGGTTILQAIKNTVSKDTQATYSKDGTGAEGLILENISDGNHNSSKTARAQKARTLRWCFVLGEKTLCWKGNGDMA